MGTTHSTSTTDTHATQTTYQRASEMRAQMQAAQIRAQFKACDFSCLSAEDDEYYMELARAEATLAAEKGEVPVGAVVVQISQDAEGAWHSKVVSRSHNLRESEASPTAHAELLAIEQAAHELGRWRLSDCCVYVTLEPCLMCAGLMVNARVGRCVYGARDPKAGALGSLYSFHADERLNHAIELRAGVQEEACAAQLRSFFKMRREQNKWHKQRG